jgi:hypothetical protein
VLSLLNAYGKSPSYAKILVLQNSVPTFSVPQRGQFQFVRRKELSPFVPIGTRAAKAKDRSEAAAGSAPTWRIQFRADQKGTASRGWLVVVEDDEAMLPAAILPAEKAAPLSCDCGVRSKTKAMGEGMRAESLNVLIFPREAKKRKDRRSLTLPP